MIQHTFIVIPCYNEEGQIRKTCASLGFGVENTQLVKDVSLILVDNNSTDGTASHLKAIKCNSPVSTVHISFEPEQGYVPARRAGNLIARSISELHQWPPENILILQADADTEYEANYIEVMRTAMNTAGQHSLIEACVGYPSSFEQEYKPYLHFCLELDNQLSVFYPLDPNNDVVVDDKVAGYVLADYFQWGGFQREFGSDNAEIFAETTRLYISANATNARRRIIAETRAYHSQRRLLEHPALHFATSGFPREHSYRKRFSDRFPVPVDLKLSDLRQYTLLVNEHKLHMLALFAILPFHLAQVTGKRIDSKNREIMRFAHAHLPRRVMEDLLRNPAIFLLDVFDLIEAHEEKLLKICDSYALM